VKTLSFLRYGISLGMPIEIRDKQYRHVPEPNFSDEPGWGVGGSEGCDAYGADGSESPYGYNSLAGASIRCNARDFARLGYLWLNYGRWGDRLHSVPAGDGDTVQHDLRSATVSHSVSDSTSSRHR
jgi:hypothetical protein